MPPVSCSLLPFIMRETQQDWMSPTGTIVLQNTSVSLRPGALTQDYLTAFSYGPLQIGFIDSGSLVRAWKSRVVSTNVSSSIFISRTNDGGTSYDPETTLFSFANLPSGTIKEMDLAFDSAGRAVIAAERSSSIETGSIWLYWFNGLASQFVFEKFASNSRSPRIVLDNPEQPSNSDLLLFYIKSESGSLRYRQQRDAYAIEYPVPLPQTLNLTGSASGTFFFAQITGSVTGNGTGTFSAINTASDWVLGQINGQSISGTFNGISTSSFNRLEFSSNLTFTGSISGSYTGTWSGSGFNDQTGSFSGSVLTGSFFGLLSGSFRNSPSLNFISGTIIRPRNGTFIHDEMIGTFTGSFTGSKSITGLFVGSGSLPRTRVSGSYDGNLIDSQFANSATGTMRIDLIGGFRGPFSLWRETYLEDVVKLKDSRVGVYYSRRDPITDQWTINRYDSILYPINNSLIDSFSIDASFISGSVRNYVINVRQTGSIILPNNLVVGESFESMSINCTTGSLVNLVILHNQTGSIILPNNLVVGESFESMSVSYFSGSIVDIILRYFNTSSYSETLWSSSVEFVTGSRNNITIVHNVFDADTIWSSSLTFVTASRI